MLVCVQAPGEDLKSIFKPGGHPESHMQEFGGTRADRKILIDFGEG